MHVRVVYPKVGPKTYRYVQLVQSVRVNGKSTQKLLGNLGDLPQRTTDNLKLAIAASRGGKRLVIAEDSPGLVEKTKVEANLRYLYLAVMMRLWEAIGFPELLRQLLPASQEAAEADKIVAALCLQRCVAPGSKLCAQRWLPTTALPELLGLPADQFGNTRIHRVLEQLFASTGAIQEKLPNLYQQKGYPTSVMFIDVTDTYFEGKGCEEAYRSRLKTGQSGKHALGIVLLANQDGLPLRWQVVSSKTKDNIAMGDMADQLAGLPWVHGKPVVCDRAMGKKSSLARLYNRGLRFLTAAPVNTIETYTLDLPHQSFQAIALQGTDDAYQQDINLVAETARQIGWEQLNTKLFVCDLGVAEVDWDRKAKAASTDKAGKKSRRSGDLVAQLRLARQLSAASQQDEHKNCSALAKAFGLTLAHTKHLLALLRLPEDIQEQLLSCEHPLHMSHRHMRRLCEQTDASQQRQMLKELQGDPEQSNTGEPDANKPPERLRLVAYFNPQMFVDQRRRTQEHLDELNAFVAALNTELANARKSRDQSTTRRKIMRQLERYDYTDAFEVVLEPLSIQTPAGAKITSWTCDLQLKPDAWARKRRYDGFVLLLGHPQLHPSGTDLAQLYRAKDMVEKDFQTIKGVIQLRPIFSYTDPKVQAHVTICMLSLSLNRILELRLKNAGVAITAPACLEILSTCHLNRLAARPAQRTLYTVTQPTIAQQEILRALDMAYLTDDQAVAETIAA